MHCKQDGQTAAKVTREAGEIDLADFLDKAGASLWTLAQNQYWDDCHKLLARRGQAEIDLDEKSSVSVPALAKPSLPPRASS